MEQLEACVRKVLVFCCHEWFDIIGRGRPLDDVGQLGEMPGFFVPSKLILELARAHERFLDSHPEYDGRPAAGTAPGEAVDLDAVNLPPEPLPPEASPR